MMKKILFCMMTLAVMAAGSCSRQEETAFQGESSEINRLAVRAILGDDGGTKTVRNEDGSIWWMPGDAINLFYGETNLGKFTTDITVPQPVATFYGSGTLETQAGSHSSTQFWAIYPYDAANEFHGNYVSMTIPDYQDGVPGTFADKLNPAFAITSGLDLTFYNVGGWFSFKVTQSGITSATFRGNNGENIAGNIYVGNLNPYYLVVEGRKSIKIRPADGGSFIPGKEYRIVLLPQTFENGYTLTFEIGARTATFVENNSVTIERAHYLGKLNADSGLQWDPNYVEMAPGLYFATRNLGASTETDCGDYFAWGEMEPYYKYQYPLTWKEGKETGYSWDSYKYTNDGGSSFTKYGTDDNRMVLEATDDPARQEWGGNWRVPTAEEWVFLTNTAKFSWEWDSSKHGFKVTSKITRYEGSSIFIPATGGYNGTEFLYPDQAAYWSSSLYDASDRAWAMGAQAQPSQVVVFSNSRNFGFPIRPVFSE